MGIKFECPNGHKLNVKSFLRGKRAICPKCGARVIVPSEEQLPAPLEESAAGASSAEPIDTSSVELAVDPAESQPVSAQAMHDDPLAEVPSAVWYVRPASGGQFGPASAEIMRAWLHEGRVGASSLVWRAGWTDWRAAAAIFPQLAGLLASPGIAVGPAKLASPLGPVDGVNVNSPPILAPGLPTGQLVQSAGTGLGDGGPTSPPLTVRRRRRNSRSMWASAVLVLLSVMLLVILFVVLRRQQATETGGPEEPSKHSETAGP